jgi:hypothetical protein
MARFRSLASALLCLPTRTGRRRDMVATAVVAAPTSVTAGVVPQSVVIVGASAAIGMGALAALALLALAIYSLRENRQSDPARAAASGSEAALPHDAAALPYPVGLSAASTRA